MKIYRLTTRHAQAGRLLSYHASKRVAQKELTAARAIEDTYEHGWIEPMEFKATRKGILWFLNNCTPATDNG